MHDGHFAGIKYLSASKPIHGKASCAERKFTDYDRQIWYWIPSSPNWLYLLKPGAPTYWCRCPCPQKHPDWDFDAEQWSFNDGGSFGPITDDCPIITPAAQERIDEIAGLSRLDITDDVRDLANALMTGNAIPRSEPRDALHVAIAAVHGVEYLVTWNFKHIANATLRTKINDVIRDNGYEPPIICTPEELAGMTDDPNDSD